MSNTVYFDPLTGKVSSAPAASGTPAGYGAQSVSMEWVSGTSIMFTEGSVEVGGTVGTVAAPITKPLSGLTADTWYYVYVSAAATLTSGNFSYSTTAPTEDASKHGYYNNSLRCIGAFYSNSDSECAQFRVADGEYHLMETADISWTPTGGWDTITLNLPAFDSGLPAFLRVTHAGDEVVADVVLGSGAGGVYNNLTIPGDFKKAMWFDGTTNGYAKFTNTDGRFTAGTGDFNFGCKFFGSDVTNSTQYIIAKGENASVWTDEVSLRLNSDGNIELCAYTEDGDRGFCETGTTVLSDSTWYDILVSWDASAAIFRVFIDGVLEFQKDMPSGTVDWAVESPFFLGAIWQMSYSEWVYPFAGYITDVRYNLDTAVTANFTVPTFGDPQGADTALSTSFGESEVFWQPSGAGSTGIKAGAVAGWDPQSHANSITVPVFANGDGEVDLRVTDVNWWGDFSVSAASFKLPDAIYTGIGSVSVEVTQSYTPAADDVLLYDSDNTQYDANTKKIANVADPTADQDAATKKYVDDNAGGGDVELTGLQTIQAYVNDSGVVRMKAGDVDIDGTIYNLPTDTALTMTGVASDTWYYLYVEAPGSGTTLSASEFSFSSTAPTQDLTKQGQYNGTDRCIGAFRGNGTNTATTMEIRGNRVYLNDHWWVGKALTGTAWETVTWDVPKWSDGTGVFSFLMQNAGGASGAGELLYRKTGTSSDGTIVGFGRWSTGNTDALNTTEVPYSSSGQFDLRCHIANIGAGAYTVGFLLPPDVYTGSLRLR